MSQIKAERIERRFSSRQSVAGGSCAGGAPSKHQRHPPFRGTPGERRDVYDGRFHGIGRRRTCFRETFLITHNVRSTISVIIVAGACGIAAGTPLAILGAIGRAARQGSIIKGGIYLEALGQLDAVFLDKTGTLTFGIPLVTKISTAPGISEQTLLEEAASAERNSEHPLGRAIVSFAQQHKIAILEPEHFEYRIGRGVLAVRDQEQTVVGKSCVVRGTWNRVAAGSSCRRWDGDSGCPRKRILRLHSGYRPIASKCCFSSQVSPRHEHQGLATHRRHERCRGIRS